MYLPHNGASRSIVLLKVDREMYKVRSKDTGARLLVWQPSQVTRFI